MAIARNQITITDLYDGQPTYTWVKYADDEYGNGMSDHPDGKRYLGLAFNKDTPNKSDNPNDYSWTALYDNVEVGARNLFIEFLAVEGRLGTGGVLDPDPEYKTSHFVTVGVGEPYIFNQFYWNREMRITLYNSEQNYVDQISTTDSLLFYIIPAGIHYARLSVHAETQPKVEKGTIPTEWTPSPEDWQYRLDQGLNTVTEQYQTAIEQSTTEITATVTGLITDTEEGLRTQIETEIQATVDSFNINFTNISEELDGIESDLQDVHTHFEFTPERLCIRKSDSPFKIGINNEEIYFCENDINVATISGRFMNIENIHVLEQAVIGVHQIERYSEDITLIRWVGDV